MKRRHVMPFGAQVLEPRGTRFRLWAPAARQVDLELWLDGEHIRQPMERLRGGWYELLLAHAPHGSRYAYSIDGRITVPDPASRCNPDGVHGTSQVIDPGTFDWQDERWRGRPFAEAVFYELHVGTFTSAGTFTALINRLDYLAELGITAIELMPVAAFAGDRNWGYDGVLPYAPAACYGTPDDLKRLVQAAHHRGLMVFLDVVYNHFGPDGNYLPHYAPQFFSPSHRTPWGAALNFDGEMRAPVRAFVIHNALYWLTEFHLDGLRIDAVHAIADASRPDILVELAEAVHSGPGCERQVHLVLENDHNAARYLARQADGRPRAYAAQWNDDFHHALHVLLTGERDGYYGDFADRPLQHLERCLTQGFAWQGEPSPYRGHVPRGEPSADLPPHAFVAFLQNHDQIGNRALGERLTELAGEAALRTAVTVLLLAPMPPLLFMGEEFGCRQPFLYFCDFNAELGAAVRAGRLGEFAHFARFREPAAREAIADPNDIETFARSRLEWNACTRAPHARWLALYRDLLALRHRHIVPRLHGMRAQNAQCETLGAAALQVRWRLGDGSDLTLCANFSSGRCRTPIPAGHLLNAMHVDAEMLSGGWLPPHCAAWYLSPNP